MEYKKKILVVEDEAIQLGIGEIGVKVVEYNTKVQFNFYDPDRVKNEIVRGKPNLLLDEV